MASIRYATIARYTRKDTMFPTDERGLSVLSCRPLIPPRSRIVQVTAQQQTGASREGDGVEGGTVRQGG
jgi:hypothetical protein